MKLTRYRFLLAAEVVSQSVSLFRANYVRGGGWDVRARALTWVALGRWVAFGRPKIHGAHSASSHWLTEQCGEKAPKLALPVARTVQTGSAQH